MWNRHAASKFADNTFRWKNHKPKDQQFKEEIEAAGPLDNLHELSQRVLGNYVKKAIVQRRAAAASTNMTADRKILTTPVKKGVSNVVLHAQRAAGIKKAEQRLDKMNPNYDTEEENKAKVQAHTHVKTDVDRSDDYDTKTFGGKWQKWRKGI
jgi:hypothetical protein